MNAATNGWTPEEDLILIPAWAEGKSTSQIASMIPGKSKNAVIGRAHRLKLPPRRSPIIRRGNVIAVDFSGCEYPHGEPRTPGFHFCGKKRQHGSSYCPEHHARCWVEPPPRNKKKQPFIAAADKLFGRVIG